jgi:hypothetical protein
MDFCTTPEIWAASFKSIGAARSLSPTSLKAAVTLSGWRDVATTELRLRVFDGPGTYFVFSEAMINSMNVRSLRGTFRREV